MKGDMPYKEIEQLIEFNKNEVDSIVLLWEKLDKHYRMLLSDVSFDVEEDMFDIYTFVDQAINSFPQSDRSYLVMAHDFLDKSYKIIASALVRANITDAMESYYLVSNITAILHTNPVWNIISISAYHKAIKDCYDRLCLFFYRNNATKRLVDRADELLKANNEKFKKDCTNLLMFCHDAYCVIRNVFCSHHYHIDFENRTRRIQPSTIRGEFRHGIGYSDLAYDVFSRNTHGQTKGLQPINIKGLIQDGIFDIPNGCKGICAINNGMPILAFRGTKPSCLTDLKADIVQYLFGIDNVYKTALGMALCVLDEFPNGRIRIFGHSLGGGLTQFCIAMLQNRIKDILGYGYNSAGLSLSTIKQIGIELIIPNMKHLHVQHDLIMPNFGYHFGVIKEVPYNGNSCKAHKLDFVREAVNMYSYYQLR